MKRKLIFITEALWVGGIETALLHLLQALDPQRYDITVLLLRQETTLAHRLPAHCRLRILSREHPGYRFRRLYGLTESPTAPSRRHRAFAWLVPILKWMENHLFVRFLRRELAGERYDTAIIYSDKAAFAAGAVQAGQWLLFYHHGTVRRICAAAWKKCRRIICVSRQQAAMLAEACPQYAHKITVIPNLVDGGAVLSGAQAFSPDFAPEKFHIVTCARLHRDKGVDLAVEACAQLAEIPDLHWWIIGGGPEEQTLSRRIRELGLENRLTLLGMRENPYPYMAACDLYVQPSRVESYGISIMEAQILGKPVLAADNPGARERLQDGKLGLLCEKSPEGIAAGIRRFLKNRPRFPAPDWAAENADALRRLEALLWEDCQ